MLLAQGTEETNSTRSSAQHVAVSELLDGFPMNKMKQADWHRVCKDLFRNYSRAPKPRWSICSSRVRIYGKNASMDRAPELIHTSFVNYFSL